MVGDAVLNEGTPVGRFVIVRPLGEGGMGMVYEARDPELERSVALKLLRGNSPVLAMRLLREAQVLARLQHPNVVSVHALDLHQDQVFIAMELVDGETLDKHIARTKPDWRGVVALFVQAGRGLVAAHAKAIVHRDVKPSNMFVDASGRVRIGDFGLARQITDGVAPGVAANAPIDPACVDTLDVSADDGTADPSERKLVGARLTHAGAVLGTPFFMSPEQLLGKAATPASDQFSFCVALWHALFGEHPFQIGGESVDAVIEGRRREHPTNRRIPGWLERALDRGLAIDPERRHPSMTALLDVLESHPARRRRLALALTGVVIAGAGIGVWGIARRSTDPCPPPTEQVASVWNDARRTQLRTHLAKVDATRGSSRFEIATRAVDRFLGTWRDAHVAACSATRVTGGQSDSLLDARMRCLRNRLAELDVGLGIVAKAADPAALDDAIGGLVDLTPITTCANSDQLALEVAAPLPPASRAKADVLLRQIAEIEANKRANRTEDLPREAAAVVAAARELGHPPTLTAALVTLARVEITADHRQAGEAALRELTQVSARAKDARSEAFAWTKLVAVVGSSRGKPAEGLALIPAASAAIVRANEPVELRIDLLYAEAEVLGVAGKLPDALAKLAEARKLLAAAGADDPRSPLANVNVDIWQETGTANAMSGNFEAAQAAYRKSIELSRVLYGPDNLDEAFAFSNLAAAFMDDGKFDDGLTAARESLRIRELRTGESARTAEVLVRIGTIYGYQENWQQARVMYERALRINREKLPAGDQQLVDAVLGLAWVDGGLGHTDDEMRGYDTVIAMFARTDSSTPSLAIAHFNRGEVLLKQKRYAESLRDYARALEVFESHHGAESPYLVTPLASYGRCLVLAGKPGDAIVQLERSLKLQKTGANEAASLGAKGWLGRALVESGRDRARGIALAREARLALEAAAADDKTAAEELADLTAWMTKQRL